MRIGLPPVIIHERLTAQEVGEVTPWHLAKLNIPQEWEKSRGKGIVVGTVDTGVDHSHEDLEGKVIASKDFTGSPRGSSDVHSHGTHVAGIITANEGNGIGIPGVAPDAKLLIAKGLGDDGGGSDRGIADAIRWLVDSGADVINLSLGSNRQSDLITEAVMYAYSRNVPIVCASGNSGVRSVSWPANHPKTISVGATDQNNRAATFTSPSSVNIAAPGVQILSCFPMNGYGIQSGTSMACPFVVGCIALIFAADDAAGLPRQSPQAIMDMLESNAIDIDRPGRDLQTGAGLVSVRQLLREPVTPDPVDPPPAGDAARITIEAGGRKIEMVASGLSFVE